MKPILSVLAAAVLLSGCSTGGSRAAATPSNPVSPATSSSPLPTSTTTSPAATSPAATPVALTGVFGVLATALTGDTYAVSIIGTDGKVVASAQASSPTRVTCGDAADASVPPPVSTSNSRVYFMDAQGVVRFLSPQGETGRATTVPAGGQRRSMFAVSPDDLRIAVIVADFTASGATTRLYVEDLNGGTNHVEPFTETGAFSLWPIGWHGGSLVVGKTPACNLGGSPYCCGPLELHVVDPVTALRRATIGGPTCVIAGPPSPAGAVCVDQTYTHASVVDWTGATTRTFQIPNPVPLYISPGGQVALTGGNTGIFGGGTLNLVMCGWINDTYVLAGGDVQQQPRIGNVITGAMVPVAAQGLCAGRLPGGL